MKKLILTLFIVSTLYTVKAVDVAAIVWPAYQPEPRWQELGLFKHGCGEWQNVYEATPKFKGHCEPRVPYWGYENEADPKVVARKIDAALAAGINIFIYDWYWYQGRPFLENALNEGFLKAPNNERMKFYIMWANHDVDNCWDNTKANFEMEKPHWSADVTFDEFKKIAHRWVDMYFKKPNYYKIDGKPVFYLYCPMMLVRALGAEKMKEALEYLDKITKDAGFPGVHLQFPIGWASQPSAIPSNPKPNRNEFFKYFGVDSITCYNWRDIVPMVGTYPYYDDIEYEPWGQKCVDSFDALQKEYGFPLCPNVTIAWDNNSRIPPTHKSGVSLNATPKKFEKFLRQTLNWIEKNPMKNGTKLIVINSWNEWTEGSYLEPDENFGYGYLNACARVLGGVKDQN